VVSFRPAVIVRLLLVAAAGLAIALLWSVYEGKHAHALEVTAPLAPVSTPAADTAKPVVQQAADTAQPVLQQVVDTAQPVLHTLTPVVQPVVDTVAPVLRPATDIVTPILPSSPLTLPAIPVLNTAPRGPSATAVAHVIATAVAQVAGDATAGFARSFTSTVGSFPSLSLPSISMPAVPLPAPPASFPSPVPLPHAPGGLGRTSGGSLAVLMAVAAVASLRGRRFRFATGVGQSIFLASLIERPG
jgi:hypothetical protein